MNLRWKSRVSILGTTLAFALMFTFVVAATNFPKQGHLLRSSAAPETAADPSALMIPLGLSGSITGDVAIGKLIDTRTWGQVLNFDICCACSSTCL